MSESIGTVLFIAAVFSPCLLEFALWKRDLEWLGVRPDGQRLRVQSSDGLKG